MAWGVLCCWDYLPAGFADVLRHQLTTLEQKCLISIKILTKVNLERCRRSTIRDQKLKPGEVHQNFLENVICNSVRCIEFVHMVDIIHDVSEVSSSQRAQLPPIKTGCSFCAMLLRKNVQETDLVFSNNRWKTLSEKGSIIVDQFFTKLQRPLFV